ncbi:HlyD family secretion protein [Bradyrhizobium japonicum]|jgi:HlyD family secretion protein|uniref:HlyD family efflux transporter periplasmic adaptor subunit n=1 Tax=Bradyrhizobium barranii subsp. barranii TaxID=2823807 RepID=A0A939M0F7_9BRAD|nr:MULTISPECIES: HlyD family efflux transporter periplasmic adaptor subunit [Bradyrhizobium]MBR0882866.1 HlyD family efflux transporter periplasmic adaptor subunit [Bradyrhizobium liaoningense]MBR0943556.1 HlyD family efflux transporter periplasmic adaptor subunit [Bradyrhizobium liaoningense]MBR1001315.1 HlyD family efflux transporter periplasmic adaptor subunit [Bradyrhizobium liaoningense]MBR1031198.1 HlyD family efflux transporter periplasmic adaptor subunit [Bradyrhizobium liaoningense]MB
MPAKWTKRMIGAAALAAIAGGLAWFAWPRPVLVDLATVAKGPIEVTADDDGKTHVRHVYTVSAPIAGKVLRISHPLGEQGPSLHVGDEVVANQTVIALMQPTLPGFIDVRSRDQLQAEVLAADAAIQQQEAEVRRIEAALDFSRTEFQRAQTLLRTQSTSAQAFDKAKFEVATSEANLASAKAQVEMRRAVRTSLAARLIDPASTNPSAEPTCCVRVLAPASGRVLKIIQDSEATVLPGAPLVDIGNPLDLEVVADLLSTDAVQIKAGAPVWIDGWGGAPITGKVVRVDPAGFLKISALGIEEQRVRVTIDFSDPPQAWSQLGHDYRVVVHVTTWSAQGVVAVPVSALFRQADQWAVFADENGRARAKPVQIGHRNNRFAEVMSGLTEGDQVVVHPSDRIADGSRIAQRGVP